MLALHMGESDRHTHQTEAARPASSPALAASSQRRCTRRYYPAGETRSETKLEHRPSPPERGSRRFCNTGTERARERSLWQQMCRGSIHDRDASWRSQRYPLRAPRSEAGAAALGSRRASAYERAGRREESALGTRRRPETTGLTDRSGGRGRPCRAAQSDRSRSRMDSRSLWPAWSRALSAPPWRAPGRCANTTAHQGGWR